LRLLGNQSEEETLINLNAISQYSGKKPWAFTFSYSRTFQASVLNTWAGKSENVRIAQEQLLKRVQVNIFLFGYLIFFILRLIVLLPKVNTTVVINHYLKLIVILKLILSSWIYIDFVMCICKNINNLIKMNIIFLLLHKSRQFEMKFHSPNSVYENNSSNSSPKMICNLLIL
jgi:hypothetical protein